MVAKWSVLIFLLADHIPIRYAFGELRIQDQLKSPRFTYQTGRVPKGGINLGIDVTNS